MAIVDFYSLFQINLFISFTSFSFYLAPITKKYVSIEKRICFKKDLLVARDQLPNNIPVPVDTGRKLNVHKTFRRRSGPFIKVRSYHLKTKCFKIWQDLISTFRIRYFK